MNCDKKRLRVINDVKCYDAIVDHEVKCEKKICKHWIDFSEGKNCVMIAAGDGPHTLQEIGKIFGLSRMRICQIEKGIYEKIKQHC